MTPAHELSDTIEHYWSVVPVNNEDVDLRVEVYVDGRADLVFNFQAPYTRIRIGHEPESLKHSNVDAQRLYPIVIEQRGDVSIAGVRFCLGGLGVFTDVDLSRITGRTVAVADVFGPPANDLQESLRKTQGSLERQKELLDSFFTEQRRHDRRRGTFRKALDLLHDQATIPEVARRSGISERTLNRLFDQFLGFAPKTCRRITRFQEALAMLMQDPGISLAEVGVQCGYYDQAHFVKEFRQFTGGVPRGYRGYYPDEGPDDFAPNVVRFLQDDAEPEP